MKLMKSFTTNHVVLGGLCAGALAVAACAGGPGNPAGPSADAVSGLAVTASGTVAASVSASSPRSGALHVTKECSEDTGLPGAFCTITSSNIGAIEVGSRVIYLQAAFQPFGFPQSKALYHRCKITKAPSLNKCWTGQ